MIIGRFLEEGHRPGFQRTFLIASRICGAKHEFQFADARVDDNDQGRLNR